MTRLRSGDIRMIPQQLAAYDNHLRRNIGLTLKGLACRAAGLDEIEVENRIRASRVCAVPMTCGQGLIENFSETLCAIASHLGFDAYVTGGTDIAGMADAFQGDADMMLTADDNRFLAVNMATRRVADNSQCTGKGFCEGLAQMAGGLKEKPVLVIGCGPVGQSAALYAARSGATVTLFDIDRERCRTFADRQKNGIDFYVSDNLAAALDFHDLIVEATPVGGVIDLETIRPETLIAAPGVPCGVAPKGRELLGGRLLWDALPIGVATMLMEVIA